MAKAWGKKTFFAPCQKKMKDGPVFRLPIFLWNFSVFFFCENNMLNDYWDKWPIKPKPPQTRLRGGVWFFTFETCVMIVLN